MSRRQLPETPIDPFAIPGALIGMPVVVQVTASSRASIYAWMQAGQFPKPKKIGNRRVAWVAADVKRWIDEKPLAA